MKKVNLYIESSSTAFQKRDRQCGYVLEYIAKTGTPVTREGFREGRGTYNQEILRTLAEALERIREPCDLTIYVQNNFVLNMIADRLETWAADNFISNGRPVMNQEEWRAVWDLIKEHKVSCQIGEHPYSGWLHTEMEETNEKNKSIKKPSGDGQEKPEAAYGGDLPETQGLPG